MSRFGVGFTGSYGVPGNDAFTKVLLHFDGANGGTAFPDVAAGGSPHTWSAVNAVTATANAKFGTSALQTVAGYISTPDSADFSLGSSDFTVDFWINHNGTSGLVGLAGQLDVVGNVDSQSIYIYRTGVTGTISVSIRTAGIVGLTSTTVFASTSIWNHIAIVRSGSTVRLFVNGVQEASASISGPVNDSSTNWGIGRIGENSSFPASSVLIDEFRLSVGVARWTSNFTPPHAPYI